MKYPYNGRIPKTCSPKCSAQFRRQSTREVRICLECHTPFETALNDAKVHCGKSCSSKSNSPKGMKWRGQRGGNGQLTLPQKRLLERLGKEWKAELAIPTRIAKQKGMLHPTHYKVDIGHPVLRIAIEVDGVCHSTKRVKILDRKKTDLLESFGWTVLRFKNEEIIRNPLRVMKKIREVL